MTRLPAMLLLTACVAPLIAGCGQKGPLYLPGDPSEIQTEIPPGADPRREPGPDEADEEPQDEDR